MIPVYGPGIVKAAEVLNAVDNADTSAAEKVQIIAQLAVEGNPKAQEAMETYKRAQGMRKTLENQAAREQLVKRQALKQTQQWAPQYSGDQPPRELVEVELKKRRMAELMRAGYSPFDFKSRAAMEEYQDTLEEAPEELFEEYDEYDEYDEYNEYDY